MTADMWPPGEPGEQLRLVLDAFAEICRQRHRHGRDTWAAALHRDSDVGRHEHQLRNLLTDLLTEAAAAGTVRRDTPPVELADFCLQALTAGQFARSAAAVGRLAEVVWSGLTVPAVSATGT